MSLLFAAGTETNELSPEGVRQALFHALDGLGPRHNVIAVPPDITRYHSRAGLLVRFAYEYYGDRLTRVLPATGTHTAMTGDEIECMYGPIPRDRFSVHDFRNGVSTLGEVPDTFVREQSEGRLEFAWPVQLNRMLLEGGFDLILSIGQVAPHEVAGMANYNKNLLIGTGGAGSISLSHYLGAVYGMERIMGRADNPVRRVLNYACDSFTRRLPVIYILTVADGDAIRGLFIGDDIECFEKASELSLKVNFTMLDRLIRKAVVYLDPKGFKSTWIGNKAIYRLRMAMADGGELIVLAPGVKQFGEDAAIDALIRKYGYAGTPAILKAAADDAGLAANLSAAAHLIHGSSEGRFAITYCSPQLGREAIEGVGFGYGWLDSMMERYHVAQLRGGWNHVGGEEIYFVPNPALGLWAHRERFSGAEQKAAA
ncbi:MAG TPA: lactate racemase domain-containing protein [Bryobacteraceae bacterium]|nr:lactate racemase domain-containing protein [Bryobacteraceae bacterium]